MTFQVGLFRVASLLLAGLVVGSCMPAAPRDEEKEPYFLAGKSRVNSMDYQGAIESFEKALEVNPQSAAAHFELGLLYETKASDPAAAIYHYERYLKLSPNSSKEDTVKTRILACKQQLAESVSLGPVTERQQREFEQVLAKNKQLQEKLEQWQAYAARLQELTNRPGTGPVATGPAQPLVSSQSVVAVASPSIPTNLGHTSAPPAVSARTHIVKAGENPMLIARKYGVKMEALMAANPKLNARHLRVGQSLVIPAP